MAKKTRMRRAICFDTAPLIWGVRGQATAGQEPMIERTARYIEHLTKHGYAIMVPAPALTEYFAGATETELREKQILARGFEQPVLDTRSAVLAAELQRGGIIKEIRATSDTPRQCLKVDALIIAIAIAEGAERIITNDVDDFSKLAKGRIPIDTVPVITKQRNMDFTRSLIEGDE